MSAGDPANAPADLAIIGGGPAGLFAAFYAGLRGLRASLFESLPFLGGQVAALYPDKRIYDVGGFPEVRGAELVERLQRQAGLGRPEIHLAEQVLALRREEDGFALTTATGRHRARALLVTTGAGRFSPRSLGVPAVDGWVGRGVQHTVREPGRFAGQPCIVVGGGDAALDWATELADAGARVSLVHRREQLRGAEASVARARGAGVAIYRSWTLEAVSGGDRPEAATLRNLKTDERRVLPCSMAVLALGFEADLSLLRAWGLPLQDGRGLVVASDSMAVAPGIWAAGDVAAYPGKLKLIATAFAEAALAVSACKLAMNPSAHLQAGHSTSAVARSSP